MVPSGIVFQSTPSGGKATPLVDAPERADRVSIHAFRGEGDLVASTMMFVSALFQSTPSGGKATNTLIPLDDAVLFQSTPSGGKATGRTVYDRYDALVSIHAFRGEGDARTATSRFAARCFNPRLPGGRRPT